MRIYGFIGLIVFSLLAVFFLRAPKGDIFQAVFDGDLRKTAELISYKPKLVFSMEDPSGLTLVGVAASMGHKDVAELLLAHGAGVNAKGVGNSDGDTPLLLAAWKGNREMVQFLLSNRAEVNAKDRKGRTPLSMAAEAGDRAFMPQGYSYNPEVVQLLLANGADVNAKDIEGFTPLHYAAHAVPGRDDHRYDGLVGTVSAEPEDTETVARRLDVVKLLLSNKAEVNAKDNNGRTPLYYATRNGYKNIADLLRQHGGQESP